MAFMLFSRPSLSIRGNSPLRIHLPRARALLRYLGRSERVNLSWDIPHLRRLTLSCNLMLNGSAAFDAVNSFRLPAWNRLDLGARYSFGEKNH